MSTWLQRWRDRTFLREVGSVVLTGATIPEGGQQTLLVGGTLQLSPRLADKSGFHPMRYHTAPTFAYESADEAKATVHATNGLVTAVYAGSTDTTVAITVTATLSDARELEDSVTVTITGDTTPASVEVTPSTTTKAAAQTQQLTTVVKNAGGVAIAGEAVTYESSDETKATVDANGLITAVATGSATVTATSVTDPTLTDTCVVTVS
jgi:uncharacterized protein YjdB